MHWNNDRRLTSAELPVASSLTDLDETSSNECRDNLGSTYDRERRIQAESWNVVTVG